MEDKIMALIQHHYNLFHRDLIYDALMDERIDKEDFIQGIKTIGWAERNDEDEFIPAEFRCLRDSLEP